MPWNRRRPAKADTKATSSVFDFTDTREPLSTCDLGPCPRRGERCHSRGARIEKNRPAAWLRLFSWSQDGVFFFHRDCFEGYWHQNNLHQCIAGDRYSLEAPILTVTDTLRVCSSRFS